MSRLEVWVEDSFSDDEKKCYTRAYSVDPKTIGVFSLTGFGKYVDVEILDERDLTIRKLQAEVEKLREQRDMANNAILEKVVRNKSVEIIKIDLKEVLDAEVVAAVGEVK